MTRPASWPTSRPPRPSTRSDLSTTDRSSAPSVWTGHSSAVAVPRQRCDTFEVTSTTENADRPRREQLEELVRIEDKVTEAAEAAAEAAAHAVEATRAAEEASKARIAKKKARSATKTAQAARSATTAKKKAGKAARAATAARQATHEQADEYDEATAPDQGAGGVLELRLTDAELELLDRMAADQDVPAPQLARTLLRQALDP